METFSMAKRDCSEVPETPDSCKINWNFPEGANDERTSRNPEIWWYSYIYPYIYIYSVCLASFWGYSNAECSNYIEPTRKSCMTCCFLHPHFSWPAILSWRFREQALSTAALRQLWWRSWSAKRRSRALNSDISLQPRRGVRLFWFHRVWKIMLQKKGSGKDRKNNMEKNEQSLYESVKRFLWGLNRRVREIWSFCIFLQLTSKKKQYLTVLNF